MFKKVFFISLLVIAIISQPISLEEESDAAIHDKFDKFCRKWGKKYTTDEEKLFRFNIFKKNYHNVREIMRHAEDGDAYGITKFFDMEPEEFRKQMLSLDVNFEEMVKAETEFEDFSEEAMKTKTDIAGDDTEPIVPVSSDVDPAEGAEKVEEQVNEDDFESDDPNDDPNADLPKTPEPVGRNLQGSGLDWRAKGAVTAVKNQGSCGSCWAFTTLANIEGLYAIKNKKLIALSEQQLVDCDRSNMGCNGGIITRAMNYVKNAGGVALMSAYPYRGYRSSCKSSTKYAKIRGYVSPGMNEESIKNMLISRGPLSAALNASSLNYYRGGILGSSGCNPYALNHGVTIVGYGTSNGVNYWIIKNSWGRNWGEAGYFRMRRGIGACGINRTVYSGVLA